MNKKVRSSNFELLRIVCMIMIVTVHTLGHGGALNNIDVESTNFVLAHFLESLAIVSVNCYILISGFFGIDSKFKLEKAFKLYIQVLFYSVIISVIFWTIGLESISWDGILSMIFPITRQTWWFMSVFLVLYMFTPYINKLLKSLSFKEFNDLLIILVFTFVIWPSISSLTPIDNQKGYSLYSFIVLYTLGAYISIFYKNKKLNKYMLLMVYLLSTISLCIFNVNTSRISGSSGVIYSYNFILIFISSIVLFLFFKELKIKSSFINKLSSLTLGVYLIHDHDYMRGIIYQVLGYENSFNSKNFILYTLSVITIIYISASIIEYLRQALFTYIYKMKFRFSYKDIHKMNYKKEDMEKTVV